MCLQFGFLIFWKKDFGAKAAHKILVKLTPGLTFEIKGGAPFCYSPLGRAPGFTRERYSVVLH
jgi:hypothetical protein